MDKKMRRKIWIVVVICGWTTFTTMRTQSNYHNHQLHQLPLQELSKKREIIIMSILNFSGGLCLFPHLTPAPSPHSLPPKSDVSCCYIGNNNNSVLLWWQCPLMLHLHKTTKNPPKCKSFIKKSSKNVVKKYITSDIIQYLF